MKEVYLQKITFSESFLNRLRLFCSGLQLNFDGLRLNRDGLHYEDWGQKRIATLCGLDCDQRLLPRKGLQMHYKGLQMVCDWLRLNRNGLLYEDIFTKPHF